MLVSEHKTPFANDLCLQRGPRGDKELLLPELDVTVGLVEQEICRRQKTVSKMLFWYILRLQLQYPSVTQPVEIIN